MGDTTAISWADHTFNPWEGCTRISPACDHCYAADRAHRFGNDHLWSGELRRTSEANWAKPRAWDRAAAASGRPARVFCASLSDVFDNQAPQLWRHDLWRLIVETPNLIWMLLTKRPQNIVKMMPSWWLVNPASRPKNIWLGTTAEDQERANQRIGHLMILGAATKWLTFVSAEPLLGEVDLTNIAIPGDHAGRVNALTGDVAVAAHYVRGGALFMGRLEYRPLGLVIAGGESGPKARPSNPTWFRRLRDDCATAHVPFHFKQWGEWMPCGQQDAEGTWWPDESTPASRRALEMEHAGATSVRLGKSRAGHLLDRVEHFAMPETA